MSSSDDPNESYVKDPRTPCKYGTNCYQKNPLHREKYKHPPQADQEKQTKKRTWLNRKEDTKVQVNSSKDDSDSEAPEVKKFCVSPKKPKETAEVCDSSSQPKEVQKFCVSPKRSNETAEVCDSSSQSKESEKKDDTHCASPSKSKDETHVVTDSSKPADLKEIIKEKFLIEMPTDFYKLYEFCKELSPDDPCSAFKAVDLLLVGPYDVLNGKLLNIKIENKDQYLRYWRYFYDPPEFQTIIKGDDKEGLHFGYWRDEPTQNPVFVATNCSKINCKIKPLAETTFGAIDNYLEEKLKKVNTFEKTKFSSLRQQLKKFATTHDIQLERNTKSMRDRERKVVTRTFHGAGIVVPYNKKTQVGYRELSETDGNLKKILNRIDEAENDNERISHLKHLDEVERWATIAADEGDVGTCLELGHNLFSSGSPHVQGTAIRMFSTAYSLLNRLEFLEIVKAHYQDRKKSYDFSTV